MKKSRDNQPLQPEDFATPEQIERNYQRIAKIGDRGRTLGLPFGPTEPPAPRALDNALPLSGIVPAGQASFEFDAAGADLPLFAG
jgi:hypothetical protein